MEARLRGGANAERRDLREAYMEWIIERVGGPKYNGRRYTRLLEALWYTPFHYILSKDANRAGDGIELRYRFGQEYRLSKETVQEALDDRECSMLEMMAALAIRCEETILTDDEEGDRTRRWFFEMIRSMELDIYHDMNFDHWEVDKILNRFMNRRYERNGHGGLFTIRHQPGMDQRDVEIWFQMMAWLIEQDEGGKL